MSDTQSHVPASEYLVLFGLLTFGELMSEAVAMLPAAEAFWTGRHRRVYGRMLALQAAGRFVDYASLLGEVPIADDALKAHTDLALDLVPIARGDDLTGGWSVNPSSPAFREQWRSHLKRVAESYALRQINQRLQSGDTAQVADMIAELHKTGSSQVLTMQQLLDYAYSQLEMVEDETIPYPYSFVERATGGIEAGGVIVVAARPSVGKSSFLQDVAIHALRAGKAVLFVSGEMPKKMLLERIQSALIGRDLKQLRQDGATDHKEEQLRGMGEMAELPGHLTTMYTASTADIEAEVRKHHGAYDLVIVDYLQYFTPRRMTRTDYERVTAVSTELTSLARLFNLPFVIAAQINREGDAAQPNMSDIKGSGQIEQDADIILTMWQQPDDPHPAGRRPVRIDLLKNRNGATFRNGRNRTYTLYLEEGLYRFQEP